MSLYGVQLDVSMKKIMHDIRMQFSTIDGNTSVCRLRAALAQADHSRVGSCCPNEFNTALQTVGIFLKSSDIAIFVKYFVAREFGFVNYHAFVDELINPMNDRRMNHARLAFSKMDIQGAGKLDHGELSNSIV